jgi:aminoglycoside phosphotransferase family enzyme
MIDPERLVAALRRPQAYPHPADSVEHIETHISHVFLAGDYAYKVKKPLALGFLDFSTLARRRHFCEEEIRLNGRLAPQIYLGVVAITGSEGGLRVGGEGEALEYAVKMRRFPQEGLLTRLPVTAELADRIAERVAEFHAAIPSAPAESELGTPEAVLAPMRENFAQIRARLTEPSLVARLAALEAWTLDRWEALGPVLRARRAAGHIRECHGDMHRGNIALVDGELIIFDGIEFNPGLRWIDALSELAFLVMDLEEAGEPRPARRLLNRYLELTGDYAGLQVLDLYKVYRAMVRAKVTAIRLGQADLEAEEAAQDRAELGRYLALAERYVQGHRPRLLLTHGVSGTGKSWLALALRERLPLVHIRSDVERKRLFGLDAEARTGSAGIGAGIYGAEAGERTYARLLALAELILTAGYSPLVDAAFLREAERRPFLALAERLQVPCTILDLGAPEPVLRARVLARAAQGQDPSEAGIEVLEHQLRSQEPLTAEECRRALTFDTTAADLFEDLRARLDAV